ncbi:PIR Superfamily Protein [Plasmodium ovale curtisi]|uniref:PIR Superfamily Protein n=1 Tax=Plasmodium ovale curtisi TaxID=864141 RepID=A0A1A8WCC0_PLAOA|nr:PIR Superfamily Protein [Plasmodium ovale curtisi]SBT00779.1 PIR Superfamily Protein [Plasmodium ovale curtisi]
MVNTTDFSYLPSVEFDKKFQEDIEYEKIKTFEVQKTKEDDLKAWMNKFKEKLREHLNKEYTSSNIDLRQKRCRDLDYWVRDVQGKMSDLLLKDLRLLNYISSFKSEISTIFPIKGEFGCERYQDNDANLEVRKKLDDYCENREYIHGLMKTENNKNFCLKYSKYIRENEIFFLNNEESKCTNEYLNPKHCIINEKCTIKNTPITFPEIKCDQYDVSYVSDNNSLQKKVLLSIPITLGICALFLFLYKYTPLSSLILNGKLKRKINDFITEERQEILEDNEEYNPQYTENIENSIGYHMMSN